MKISTLPMFPLTIMPLPGERTALHIFEQRYRQLLDHLEMSNGTFGIPYITEDGDFKYGVEMKLVEVTERYESGESDIVVEAVGFFEVETFHNVGDQVLYPTADILKLNGLNNKTLNGELMKEWVKFSEDVLEREDLQYFTNVTEILPHLSLSPIERLQVLKKFKTGSLSGWIVQRIRMQRVIASQRKSIKRGFSLN